MCVYISGGSKLKLCHASLLSYDEDEALAQAVAASLADQESSSQRQRSGQVCLLSHQK